MKKVILLVICLLLIPSFCNAGYSFEKDKFDNSAKCTSVMSDGKFFNNIFFSKIFSKTGSFSYNMILWREGSMQSFLDSRPVELKINNEVYNLNMTGHNEEYKGEGKSLAYNIYSIPQEVANIIKNNNNGIIRVTFMSFEYNWSTRRMSDIPNYSQEIISIPPAMWQEWQQVINTNADGSITKLEE